MEEDPLQLQDLVPSDPLLRAPALPWWFWTLIGVAVVLVVTLGVLLARRRHPASGPPPLPDPGVAFRMAAEALKRAASLPAREAATASSGALRRYLAMTCRDPSLYETHEEFLARHEALKRFPEATRQRTSDFFSRLAGLKYDKDRSDSADEVVAGSFDLLELLHQQQTAA